MRITISTHITHPKLYGVSNLDQYSKYSIFASSSILQQLKDIKEYLFIELLSNR